MYYIDGKLILFTTVTNESIKQKTLYIQEVSKSGKIIGKSKAIGRLTNQNIVVNFNIDLTSNGKNMFVHYYRPFQMYNEEPYFFKIYNSSMDEVLNKTIKLPLVEREFSIIQYEAMKDGNTIVMLAKLKPNDERSSRRRGPVMYQYSILIYDVELNSVKNYPVNVLKLIPQNAMFGINERDKVIDVMGFVAKKGKFDYTGVFHERFDMKTKEWAVVDRKTTYLTIDKTKLRYFRAPHLTHQRENIYNYQLRDLVYLGTGEPVLIAEHYNEYLDSIVDPRTKEVSYNNYYRYGDILLAKVDRENKFEWMVRLPKSQYSYNDFGDYSSFGLSVVGEKLKLYYNGNAKNIKMLANDMYNVGKLAEAKSPGRSGTAITATVFSDGKIFGSYMFDGKNKKQIIKPAMLTDTHGKYFIYTKKGSMMKFAKFYID